MGEIISSPGTTTGPLLMEDVLSPAEIRDNAAKQLVVEDARTTRSWIDSRFFR